MQCCENLSRFNTNLEQIFVFLKTVFFFLVFVSHAPSRLELKPHKMWEKFCLNTASWYPGVRWLVLRGPLNVRQCCYALEYWRKTCVEGMYSFSNSKPVFFLFCHSILWWENEAFGLKMIKTDLSTYIFVSKWNEYIFKNMPTCIVKWNKIQASAHYDFVISK